MTFQVESRFMVISNFAEVIAIRRIAKEMAQDMGFEERVREEIGLVVSELATNIIKYAQRGLLTITPVYGEPRDGLVIEAVDDGLGFNEGNALRDGFSTSGTLGTGLGAVNRLVDEFDIFSREENSGTRIVCKRWLPNTSNSGQNCPFEFGVISRPKPTETVNGDTFVIKHIHGASLVGVIDGVGHGILASQAANAARQYVEHHCDLPLPDIFRGVERACRATRGVVMALTVFDWTREMISFASVGNIEVKVVHGSSEKAKFIVRRGILGKNAPQPVVTENSWRSGDMLALHSDGLSTHWHWDSFAHYASHPAQVIAEQIYNEAQKDHDDATIVIVK